MAEPATPKRPPWFWPVVALVVVILAAGVFAAPSVLECTGSRDGFGTCLSGKLADLGIGSKVVEKTTPDPEAVAVAEPANTAQTPVATATVIPPDFGARVEPNGSIVIAGSGARGKTIEIYVNGKLYGTADVEPSGDWVLVPAAPLPPGGYEITVVDPESGTPLDKSIVVAINQDLTSEPLVVASTVGKASDILQGLGQASGAATAVAQAETPVAEPAKPAEDTTEPISTAVATAEDSEVAIDAINQAAVAPEGAAELTSTPPVVAPPVAAVAAPAEQVVATVEPGEDVVGDVDALQKRIDALKTQAAPTIDAVEIDSGRNFFAGTGADGAVVRVYVDNVHVGDAEVKEGHWLLETSDVLKNRSQRVRVDQLVPGTAEVASRAEIDFIFEEPAVAPAETAVAEAPVTVMVPPTDFSVDVATAPITPEQEPMVVADVAPVASETPVSAEEKSAAATQTPPATTAETPPAEPVVTPPAEPVVTPPVTTAETPPVTTAETPPAVPAVTEPVASVASSASTEPAGNGTASSSSGPEASGSSTAVAASGSGSGTAVSGIAVEVPKPDFSIDTGIPVTIVPETPATVVATAEPTSPEPVAAKPEEPKVEVDVATAEPVVTPAPEVPALVAEPVGPAELGRFSTGKAIIRSGDNLWTIARRVYGSGLKYTQIYGANRDQIRDPDLIYPGQVFGLPDEETKAAIN